MSESKINIPKFSYPFKKVQSQEKYYDLLEKETHGNYLFSKDGFWHGGIHFNDSLTEFSASEGIRAIADGELVAFRINDEYLQNDDKEKDNEGLYSNGFFLLKHYFEYPVGNKLTFFSLYMHTAKKQTYFSKITGNGRNIRVGYSNSSNTIKEHTQEFDKDTNIITDGKWDKKTNRTKVLYVEGLDIDLSQTPTIHKTNVDKISEVEYFETIGKIFQQNVFNKVNVLETPIQIKAGDVLGLVGEYNINHGVKRDLLHLEVFTGDDVKGFANSAKTAYEKDTSKDKPKPTKIKIQSGKIIYEIKEQGVVESSDGTATIKDSNNVAVSTQAPLNNGTKIEVDTSTIVLNNRYKILKIDTNDVSNNNWNIYKGSIGNIQVAQSTDTTQSEDITLIMSEIKTITLDNKKYVYINKEQTKGILYSDCKEYHPITFDWATIIDESSSDDISIFSNIEKYLLPELEELKKKKLEINSLYKELFKIIDKDSNGQIDAQELEEAAKDKAIKKLTSKYIVKHSSEWDKKVNLPKSIKTILEKYKDNVSNYDRIIQHLDNEEKRVENLNFFDGCSSIDGFPDSDKVFHINPIGLVGEFGSHCNIKIEQHLLTPNQYSRPQTKVNIIKAIVIHWVANPMSKAINNRNFFENRKNGQDGYGSAHYIIGLEGEIIQCLPEDEVAYHVGGTYTDYAINNLSSYPNNCTIGIELTHIDWEGKFKESTLASARCLCQGLLSKYNLTKENIVRHYDVTGKDCPKYFVDNEDEFTKFKNSI
ncbi:N-acetylmuramoyl-L-alanine amidase [Campylobacterota bacterium DY0563]